MREREIERNGERTRGQEGRERERERERDRGWVGVRDKEKLREGWEAEGGIERGEMVHEDR